MSKDYIDNDIFTKLHIDSDNKLFVERWQDAQDIADHAAHLRDQPQHGADFHHKWSLPNTIVEKFYQEYCGVGTEPKPMNQEFWEWVHKQMKDPQYSKFWTHNPSNPFRLGYNGRSVKSDI